MQIDRLNHLHFPPDSNPAPTGKEPASAAGAHAKPAAAVRPNVPTLVDRTAHQPPSVVLKIQNKAAEGVDDTAADAPIYSGARWAQAHRMPRTKRKWRKNICRR